MKKLLVISLAVSTLFLTGCSWNKKSQVSQSISTQPTTQDVNTPTVQSAEQVDAMMGTGNTGDAIMEKETMGKSNTMEKKDSMEKAPDSESAMQKDVPGAYESYSTSAVQSALSAGKKVVLFFHAPRCPSCRTLDKELNASISSLPVNTIVFKVDYDSSTDLKKTYGVTSQHTLVRIDANMNLVQKQTGGDAGDVITMLK